jgi:micrococcal nuclease
MKTLVNLALAILLLNGAMALGGQAAKAKEQKQPAPAFVASVLREPFHKPSCEWAKKISAKNLETFKTRDEAVKAGHRPCKVCRP